jgi:hypothetical protein
VLLRTSRTELLRVAFAPTPAEQATMSCKRGARFSGIVAKFAHQLGELNAHLKASEIHFIRCIKPNAKLQPRLFDDAKVRAQIKCNCIVDACLIMKAGFPERLLFGHVINTYGCLAPTVAIGARRARAAALRVQPIGGDGGAGSVEAAGAEEVAVRAEKQACSALMLAARLNADAWGVGNTRLCLKVGVLPLLDHRRQAAIDAAATRIAAAGRGLLARQEARDRRAALAAAKKKEAEEATTAAAAAAAQKMAAEAEARRSKPFLGLSLAGVGTFSRGFGSQRGTPRGGQCTPRNGQSTPRFSLFSSHKQDPSSPTKGSPSAQMLAHAPGSAYANAANGFVPGDAAWYVTRAGHVRAVRVLCAAASIFAAATAADGSAAAKDGVAFVAERYAVEYLSGAGGP